MNTGSDSADDDYLSDKFIKSPAARPLADDSSQPKSPRPQQQQLSRRQLEQEARQNALQTPLTSANTIGFKMLYGKCVAGKDTNIQPLKMQESLSSVNPPIMSDLLLKVGTEDSARRRRRGVGRAEMEQRLEEIVRSKRQRETEEVEAVSASRYQRRHVDRRRLRQLMSDLHQGRVACELLDSQLGLFRHVYWPQLDGEPAGVEGEEGGEDVEGAKQDDEENGDGSTAGVAEKHGHWFEQLDAEEKLRLVTRYLRQTHKYCQWCGCKYQGEDDMLLHCPGDSADHH